MPIVELLSRDSNIARVKVAFDATEVNKEFNRVYRELANSLKLPGFRKGKIPPNIIRQRVGVEEIAGAVEDYLRDHAADYAIAELNLFPRKGKSTWHEQPTPVDQQPLAYEFSFPVMPETKLPDYTAFEFTLPKLEVTEGMKERFYERMRDRMTEFPEKDGAAGDGDGVLLKLTSTHADSGLVAPFMQEVMLYVLGKEGNLPGWDEKLAGALKEQVIEFDYAMPEDFTDPEVAGKPLKIRLETKTVHTVNAPVFDDAYVKEHFGMETLADYDKYVVQHLAYERDAMQGQMKRDMVVQKLIEGIEAELTEDMLVETIDSMVKENEREMKEQGTSLHEQLEKAAKAMDEYRESLKPMAENRLKMTLAVRTLAAEKELRPTIQDFERYAAYMAQREGITPKQFKELLNYPDFVNEITYQIMQEKVLDFLVGSAKFTSTAADAAPVVEGRGQDAEETPAMAEDSTTVEQQQ